MKRIKIASVGMAVVLSGLIAGSVQGQEATTMQAFMRKKMAYSQGVIEGITLERPEMVITNASKLMAMTKSNLWMKLSVQGFYEKTWKYQDEVLALTTQARLTNNAGMLKAFASVTASCIDCHQVYRPAQANGILAASGREEIATQSPQLDRK
jgi:cytochrome c556